MAVTAEGVETAEQLAFLKALNCEFGQGYFFSKAVGSHEAGRLIAKECGSVEDSLIANG
jgi:EAL domain-containing protein (putative c-di-GMP-specific phosphodiesterase class I)